MLLSIADVPIAIWLLHQLRTLMRRSNSPAIANGKVVLLQILATAPRAASKQFPVNSPIGSEAGMRNLADPLFRA